ncbi:MAG: LptF/LptG family permease [Phycisphaerales bacterium]|jgi:lipopolysaccharide export LptBFGC system permease protein LptF
MRGFPLTLWRFIALDLVRLVVVTSSVLVTIIAFAGAIKPLSDGSLQAADAARYILFAIPPMLAYALPFAGGFAATLVYHRIGTELETIAAYAGGISHRVLLAPALAVALLCSLGLVALNEQLIPAFLRQMQVMVTVDVGRLLTNSVARGQSLLLNDGKTMIIADTARLVTPKAGSGILSQVWMTHFAAVETVNGLPVREVTANIGQMWIMPASDSLGDDHPHSVVYLRLEDVVAAQQGKGLATSKDHIDLAFPGPDIFKDNVKFLSWREIMELKDHPERMNWVDKRRVDLANVLAERHAVLDFQQQVAARGSFTMRDDRGREVVISCGRMAWVDNQWHLLPGTPGGEVEVRYTRSVALGADANSGERLIPTVISAAEATLSNDLGPDRMARRTHFRLVLEQATSHEAGIAPPRGAARSNVTLDDVTPADTLLEKYLAMHPAQLVEDSKEFTDKAEPDPAVVGAAWDCRGALTRLDNDILSKRNERMALAASCTVMILAGAVSALYLSRRQPLTVYLFTFFPALLTYVTISGGQQITTKQGAIGLVLMWSSVGLLLLYTGFVYLRLRRN